MTITKTEIQEMIDRLADKSLTEGCEVSLYFGEAKMRSVLCKHNKGEWIKVGTKRPSFKNHGHPILIGDVLEKMAFNWAKKAIDEHLHNTIWILEKEQADLLKLWQPCGFARSLQQIFEDTEWEFMENYSVCHGSNGPTEAKRDAYRVPKQPAICDLFIFLKSLTL